MADKRKDLAIKLINLLLNHPGPAGDFRDEISEVSSVYLPPGGAEQTPWEIRGLVVRFHNGDAFRVTVENHTREEKDIQ